MKLNARFEKPVISSPASDEAEKLSRASASQEMAQAVLRALGVPELIKIGKDYMNIGAANEPPVDKLS